MEFIEVDEDDVCDLDQVDWSGCRCDVNEVDADDVGDVKNVRDVK